MLESSVTGMVVIRGTSRARGLRLLLALGMLTPAIALGQDKNVPLRTAVGVVKIIAADMVTLTDRGEREWSFAVGETTKVIARGVGHKSAGAQQTGKPLAITDLVKEGQRVRVRYYEADGKLRAAEVRVI